MALTRELPETLQQAFGAAFLLTGSAKVAEDAVLDGIAASPLDDDEALVLETVKSAIRRRANCGRQPEQPPSHVPEELRRLILLSPISRDCFTLRVLLGLTARRCSAILHLSIRDIEEVLCAALQQLPLLES